MLYRFLVQHWRLKILWMEFLIIIILTIRLVMMLNFIKKILGRIFVIEFALGAVHLIVIPRVLLLVKLSMVLLILI